jgi:hypothetical protein
MHKTLLLFALLIANLSFAGGFRFPNVEFAYAKLYLFNLDLMKPNHMDFRIYDNGMYAVSKIGNGQLLSNEFHSKVAIAFKNGIDELEMGLSKCFMPRHGIIYYDSEHLPVASLSICFECDKISVWSREPILFKENYDHFNFKKAEKQIADLAEIVKNEKIPVYTSPSDEDKYWEYIDAPVLSAGIRRDHASLSDSLVQSPEYITAEVVKKWLYSTSHANFGIESDSVGLENGTSHVYRILPFAAHSKFVFEENGLIYARIVSNQIKLPFDFSIGMSSEEVYRKINLPQDPYKRSPDQLIVSTSHWNIGIWFRLDTVSKIELYKN